MGTVLAIVAVIVVVMVIVMKQKTDTLFEEGKMVKRKDLFYEKAHLYTVKNVPWDIVVSKATSFDIPEAKITETYPNNGGRREVLYKSSQSWNALLKQIEEKDDVAVYQFDFPVYMTRRELATDMISMNVMQTAVEKMFLELDPQTKVESHEIERKTRRV